MASIINVNGRTIILPDGARNVSISNNRVYVDGVELGAGHPLLDDVDVDYVIKGEIQIHRFVERHGLLFY